MTHRSTSSWDSLDDLDDWRELAGPPASSGALDDDAEDAKRSAASRADVGWRRETARLRLSPTRRPIDAPVDAWFALAEETLTSAPPRPNPTSSFARDPTAREPSPLSSPRWGERDPPTRARRTVTPSPPRRRVRNPDADANHPAGFEPARVHLVLVSLLIVIHAATTTPFLRPRPAAAPRGSPRSIRLEIQTPAPAATPASDAVLALPGGRVTDAACGGTRTVALEAEMRARTVALEAEVLDLRARLDDAAAAAAETAAEAEATRRTADEEEAEARARAWYDAYREVRETCGRSDSGARWGGGWMGAATVSSGASAWT